MNPNNPNNVDPKLMQAYEAAMSGSAQPVQDPNQAAPQQPMMQTEQLAEQPQAPQFTPPPLPQNEEVMQSPLGKGAFVNPNPSNEEAGSIAAPKKKNKLLPVFLTVGGILFFVVYAVIWSKVFGLF